MKEEYLTTYPTEKWQEKFVMLSTWNEYGEGTYMMPTTDEKGFQYLDVIREAYTAEKEDASINTVPNAEQKYRLNRLYPQYRRLLRKEGYVVDEIDTSTLESVYTIDYSTRKNVTVWSVTDKVVDGNGISGVTNGDAIIMINDLGEYFSLGEVVGFKIKAKFPKGTRMQVFFSTDEDNSWSEGKSKTIVSTSDDIAEYFVLFGENPYWNGTLVGVRIDPVSESGHPFTLKSAELVRQPSAVPKEMIINGQTFSTNFRPETASNGDTLVAFDPRVGLDVRLNIFHEWSKDMGVLTLNFPKKVMVFTVGSDEYFVDGEEKRLDYSIGELDGLPLLPINVICDEMGYDLSVTDKGILCIDTDQRWYYDEISDRVFGQWEFNTRGDTENWSSSFMSLLVNDGYMACESTSSSTDPTIVLGDESFEMLAEKYKAIEYRVRYKYSAYYAQSISMYFITNNDATWSEAKSIKTQLKSKDSGGEWETYVTDLTSLDVWKDTIVDLRFDPFNATGFMDVDYIRFIPDEKYVTDENKTFVINNGDAEELGAVSFEGTKIVLDPESNVNHCFAALGNQGENGRLEYIYSTHEVIFTPGAKYKVSCDIKLAQHGGKEITNPGFKAWILSNMKYSDPISGSNDHVVARKNISAADGWVHWEYEFIVSAASVIRTSDLFTFYSDPVDGLGVGYYFDNVVVEEILPE